uniref:Uncharacterized protein n=1 Tax=Podarcis muralis TaxID=64176 RepID=A0A670JR31_PODMU
MFVSHQILTNAFSKVGIEFICEEGLRGRGRENSFQSLDIGGNARDSVDAHLLHATTLNLLDTLAHNVRGPVQKLKILIQLLSFLKMSI